MHLPTKKDPKTKRSKKIKTEQLKNGTGSRKDQEGDERERSGEHDIATEEKNRYLEED